jgi:hypothetical protein
MLGTLLICWQEKSKARTHNTCSQADEITSLQAYASVPLNLIENYSDYSGVLTFLGFAVHAGCS